MLDLIDSKPEAAADSTGLEAHCRSGHYARKSKRYVVSKWPKLTLVALTHTHLITGMSVTEGPSQDAPLLSPVLRRAVRNLPLDRLLADAGYDAEHNHVTARKELHIRSTVIRINPRRAKRRWPPTKYRRQMRRRFQRRVYGQRWQIESVISRNKRKLGWQLRTRSAQSQERDCQLQILTHNLLILGS